MGDTYDSYAAAASAVGGFSVDCFAYLMPNNGSNPKGTPTITVNSASADVSTPNEIILSAQTTQIGAAQPLVYFYACLTISDVSTLTIAWTESDDGSGTIFIDFQIFNCDGTPIEQITKHTATGSESFAPVAAGIYIIAMLAANTSGATTVTASFTITTDGSFVPNPVIALWDDSGTTRQLEACPKLILPYIEGSGIWYSDQTEAQNAINDFTSNCVGFAHDRPAAEDNFVATDLGSSLRFAVSSPNNGGTYIGSINLVIGSTVTATWSGISTGLGDGVAMFIVEPSGSSVASAGSNISPVTTGTIPYTGKFYVVIIMIDGAGLSSATVTVTSSDTLTVNPIQALYDAGLDCPARLDCS